MNYAPAPPPSDARELAEYVYRELKRAGNALKDNSPAVLYEVGGADAGTLTAGISANWRIPEGNVIRLSASATLTLTGIFDKTPERARWLVNVGGAAVVLLSDNAASSTSYRFLLAATLQLSANAAVLLWYDARSARHRALART